jgi:hypothetical protein
MELIILSSCTTVQYYDSVWCSSPNLSLGGTCVHFLTTQNSQLNSDDYIKWLVGSDIGDKDGPKICTTAATLSAWKGDLEKECSKHSDCSFNANIIDSIDSILKLK